MKKNTDYSNPLIVQNVQQKAILSFREALVYTDCSQSFLYKLVHNRAITFLKPNGGRLYFKKSDLDNWMTQNEFKSTRVLEEEINNHLKKSRDGKKIN